MSNKTQPLNFETTLNTLEELIGVLESSDLPLDTALSTYEQGVTLIKAAEKTLDQAEQKIKILNKDHKLSDFTADDNQS